jgi:glycosyltransferase involved in cell wall biosynthesis
MGEVVLARNFVRILSSLYETVKILSTVDTARGSADSPINDTGTVGLRFCSNEQELRRGLAGELIQNHQADVHFINASLLEFLGLIPRARRTYLYQFAYDTYNDLGGIIHSIGALPLTFLGKIRIITTSFQSHRRFGELFRRQYYYVPAPIEIPDLHSPSPHETGLQLRILYLGHGSYVRFPYDRIIGVLSRLKREGYKIRLDAYVSEQGYVDYRRFVKAFNNFVAEHDLRHSVKLCLGNLSEQEKYRVISESDVVLYVPLASAAIDPPLVILEAMSLGKCIIATSLQSIPYILEGNSGIIISPKNLVNDLHKALRMLADEPRLLRQYGTSSRNKTMKTYAMDAVQKIMKEIIAS